MISMKGSEEICRNQSGNQKARVKEVQYRQHNVQNKMDKGQKTIYKALPRK